MSAIPTICVVDDDEAMRVSLENLLRSCGYAVRTFDSALAFLASGLRPACIVSDLQMPGMNGVELKRTLIASGLDVPVIIVTAFPEDRIRTQAEEAGVLCFFQKPFKADDLIACVEAAVAG